jgi:hypothetical protein
MLEYCANITWSVKTNVMGLHPDVIVKILIERRKKIQMW